MVDSKTKINPKTVTKMLRRIERAYKSRKFGDAASLFAQFPEEALNDDLRAFRDQINVLWRVQCEVDKAQRHFNQREFDKAVEVLEQLPDEILSEQARDLLNESRQMTIVDPIIQAAKTAIQERNYAYALEVLDSLDSEYHNKTYQQLKARAETCIHRSTDLRKQIDDAIRGAHATRSLSLAKKGITYIKELMSIAPLNDPVHQELVHAEELADYCEHRDEMLESATEHLEKREYDQVISILESIPRDLRDAQISEVLDEAITARERIVELTSDIMTCIEDSFFESIEDSLNDLEEFVDSSRGYMIERLGNERFEEFLIDLSKEAAGSQQLQRLLDSFIDASPLEPYYDFLPNRGEEFLEVYPEECRGMHRKLMSVLETLADDPSLIRERVALLQSGRQHLHDDEYLLRHWESLIESLDEFDLHQHGDWRWHKTLLENEETRGLDAAGARLAEAADRVISGESRSDQLQTISEGRLANTSMIVRRVYAKINEFLETGEWPTHAITLVTMKRAVQVATTLIVLTMLGAVLQLLMATVFGIGGLSAYAFVFFLAGLWTFFWVAANRIL